LDQKQKKRLTFDFFIFVSFSKIVALTSRFGYFCTAVFLLQHDQQSKKQKKTKGTTIKKLLLP
jgi:hypothetical protein